MASFWHLSLYCSFLVLCIYDAVSSECDIEVSKELARIDTNGNLSVLCDTPCIDGDKRGDMIWYDNKFNQVPQVEVSGRIFSISYGRGRYSRLVILNSTPTDAGIYICTLETNDGIKQRSFTLIHDGPKPAIPDVEQDIGPRRGDVVIYDPDILHPRPKRGVVESDMSTVDGMDKLTTDDMDGPSSPSSGDDAPETKTPSQSTNTHGDTSRVVTITTSSTPISTSQMSPKTKPEPNTESTNPTTNPEPTNPEPTNPEPNNPKTNPESNSQDDTKPMPGSNSKVPNTEFGRSGLVAFVVSLSIALLLLYALLLILLIPMCLKRKKRRTSTKKKSQTTKDTTVVLSQVAKSDDNGDLPSPGPSDAGFTTIDLDDPPKDKQQEKNAQQESDLKQNDDLKEMESLSTKPETTNEQNSILSSVMLASDTGAAKPVDPPPGDDDLKFIDETNQASEAQKLDDSSVFDNSTPNVVDEPQRPTTETTEVKLEITEKEDGQKQIKLSSSSPPRDTQSESSQSSN